jgi:hypothetical protein
MIRLATIAFVLSAGFVMLAMTSAHLLLVTL